MMYKRELEETSKNCAAGSSGDNKVLKQDNGPTNWKKIYENILKMRADKDAPIDYFGCERCHDETDDEKVQRFQTLVSLMLSSQTKDEVTHAAMERLKAKNLSVKMIEDIDQTELEKLLFPVGFYRRKAEYLKKTATILTKQYDMDIPDTIEKLIKLPGVGPKMAHLAMQVAWGQVTGVAVDTHVHRICNRFQWVNAKTPESTQKQLEEWLPKEYWEGFNHALVGFGQTICLAERPKCDGCLNRDICPASQF